MSAAARRDTTLTIVVPVWDAYVAFLPGVLAAFAAATDLAADVLVVDNASSVPIGESAGATVLRSPGRLGPGAARNHGLAAVTTPYVMFWDVDDDPITAPLAPLLGRLAADPGLVAAVAGSTGWNPDTGDEFPWPWPRRAAYALQRRPRALALLALVANPFPTTGPAVLRTAAVRDAGGFSEDATYGEDWGLSAALALRGRVWMTPEPGRRYRVHERSLTQAAQRDPRVYADGLRSLRQRARHDPRMPTWMTATRPVVRAVHALRAPTWQRGRSGGGFYTSGLRGGAGS